MTIENIDVSATIKRIRRLLKKDKTVSSGLVAAIELLITIVKILLNQKNLNSRNSSKPPSQDPNRPRKTRKDKGLRVGKKKPGGQKGHHGSNLKPVDHPDKIEEILIDRKTLPKGEYTSVGFKKRQVFDLKISLYVTEYRGEILENKKGSQWIARFPKGVNNPTQYGNAVKAHCVYMSQFQLIPHLRVASYFKDQLGLSLSKASVQNFNSVAYKSLGKFEDWAKKTLLASELNHADETGVNINGKRWWFHLLCNDKVALYHVDKKRGHEATDRMGILPKYKGTLCHDHWKSYYRYSSCIHALCNAHHIRELKRAWEQDGQKWAKQMEALLIKINEEVKQTKQKRLPKRKIKFYQKKYRAILLQGEKECPPAVSNHNKRGRTKQSKSRNLLERLRDFEDDTLRFMKESIVLFTNNRAENDLRMTKVQQKISGCFRSLKGAQIFCRIRSYLITCRKNGVPPTQALKLLFEGKLPDFIT